MWRKRESRPFKNARVYLIDGFRMFILELETGEKLFVRADTVVELGEPELRALRIASGCQA